jgi:hypothetical protein
LRMKHIAISKQAKSHASCPILEFEFNLLNLILMAPPRATPIL